jgi:hypothetical protein
MNLFADTRALVYLFISLRLMLILVFQAEIIQVGPSVERGLTSFGDWREYYGFSAALGPDFLPYRDYWVEFPPVWIGLTGLLAQIAPDFTVWALYLYLILLGVETANLLLIKSLGTLLYDEGVGMSLAWVYNGLGLPLIVLAWSFESLVLLSLLGPCYFYLRGRPAWPGAALTAFGILSKYLALLWLPTLWKFAPRPLALRYSLISLGLVALVMIPLLLWGGEMAWQSLTVQASKPPYHSPWALMAGYYGTGSFPGGEARLDPQWRSPYTSPAYLQLRIIPFALLGLWAFFLPIEASPINQFRFFSLTLGLFMLWSGGWSPQWGVVLGVILLLNFPDRLGLLLSLLMMAGALLEYPVLFRQANSAFLTGGERLPFAALVLLRTALMSGVCYVLIRQMMKTGSPSHD